MNIQKPTVLVLGATGTIGKQVVKELEANGTVNVRIPSRNLDTVAKLKSEGKDAVYLDLDKPQTFALALAGVERVFLLTGYTVAMLAQSKTLVDAAKKAGVKHIVHIGIFAEWDCTSTHFTWHQLIETYIEASGIAWTHIHPNMFMEAITGLYMPKNLSYTTYFDDRRIGLVASSDIAAVSAKVLIDGQGKHAGQNYWLSVESYNGKEIVAMMNDVTGLNISLEHKNLDDFRAMIDVPDFPIENQYARANIEFVTQVLDNRLGSIGAIRNDIPYVLGRPAKTLREHLTEHKDAIIQSATQS
ncbi:SDR family oxidoreductase [Mannheimia indoligenes]|uniref:SDR family oxidoreductase n=1 Tax=Mannheimia indoligenes TaxID=3103145 RepID=UPI002FE535D4